MALVFVYSTSQRILGQSAFQSFVHVEKGRLTLKKNKCPEKSFCSDVSKSHLICHQWRGCFHELDSFDRRAPTLFKIKEELHAFLGRKEKKTSRCRSMYIFIFKKKKKEEKTRKI
jgi:hypothetical protein